MIEASHSFVPEDLLRGEAAWDLESLVGRELDRDPHESCRPLVAEIRRQLGNSLASVIFYGSCLRGGTDLGVLDFYAIVDDYQRAHSSRLQGWANALLPPSVFYAEVGPPEGSDPGAGVLCAKYAVVSFRDLLHAASGHGLRSGIWARFSQPALIAYARDDGARRNLHRVAAQSILTALQCALPLLPEHSAEDTLEFSVRELWQVAFTQTYANELRPESPERVKSLYDACPERYERATRHGLAQLQADGALAVDSAGPGDLLRVSMPLGARRRRRRLWRARRPLAKATYALQLLKSAFTFGDGVLHYALWKVEHHSGTRFIPSERQRRHPLLFGWPLLFQILRQRLLR